MDLNSILNRTGTRLMQLSAWNRILIPDSRHVTDSIQKKNLSICRSWQKNVSSKSSRKQMRLPTHWHSAIINPRQEVKSMEWIIWICSIPKHINSWTDSLKSIWKEKNLSSVVHAYTSAQMNTQTKTKKQWKNSVSLQTIISVMQKASENKPVYGEH